MPDENSIINALLANLPQRDRSALANARAEADKWQATARRYQQLYNSLLAVLPEAMGDDWQWFERNWLNANITPHKN